VLELRLFRVNNRRNMDGSAASGIGILGGTFNPVHLGHLILAQTALETFDLSRILLVPCAVPPHKEAAGLIAAGHRRAMVEAAIEGDLRFDLCDAELRRGGVSYAVDTVRELPAIFSSGSPGVAACSRTGSPAAWWTFPLRTSGTGLPRG